MVESGGDRAASGIRWPWELLEMGDRNPRGPQGEHTLGNGAPLTEVLVSADNTPNESTDVVKGALGKISTQQKREETDLTTLELALDLAEFGMHVFPVAYNEEENTKTPFTKNGHLAATRDPGVIQDWWEKWPNAQVGVFTGKSGINVADIDVKNGKDGWADLEQRWYDTPDTFSYDTHTGGTHLVYKSLEGLTLYGNSKYRKMPGVDRRAGSSWVMWVGPVPSSWDEITPAPEWLNDERPDVKEFNFSGDLQSWYEGLVPGEPNALVRRAIEQINPDMSHSEMVAAQHHAIRLGAEGNSGVPQLLEALQDAWETRPAENHTTPEGDWTFKFTEALESGLEKFGDSIDLVKNLPPYSIQNVPSTVSDALISTPAPGDKTVFSRVLRELVKGTEDDDQVASILWNSPATKETSRDWGLLFVYKRIQEARIRPEPTRENPRIEEKREAEAQNRDTAVNLLTDDERKYLSIRPTFADRIERIAEDMGYDQTAYFRAIAWNMASLAYGLKGYVYVSDTQRHGLNLWNIIMGDSGTGKSVTKGFRDQALRIIFDNDNPEGVGFDLGTDSTPQGLHLALLERDGKASLFSADEASGFFKALGKRDWNSGLEDTLSDWYMGHVAPSNKVNMKELRGKSAKTSFNMQMFATPDRLAETLTRDQFNSGFLARIMWSFGNPKVESKEMFNIFKDSSEDVHDAEVTPKVIEEVASDLISSRVWVTKPLVLRPTSEAKKRIEAAYEKMFNYAKDRENWDIIEPAVTRHMEAILKCAGISAMYREDSTIELVDALHAIRAVEEWFTNLFRVADLISAGQFQRRANEVEAWIIERGGRVTRAALFHRFRNFIEKDPRELDNLVNYLLESGIINREEEDRSSVKYALNGAG